MPGTQLARGVCSNLRSSPHLPSLLGGVETLERFLISQRGKKRAALSPAGELTLELGIRKFGGDILNNCPTPGRVRAHV